MRFLGFFGLFGSTGLRGRFAVAPGGAGVELSGAEGNVGGCIKGNGMTGAGADVPNRSAASGMLPSPILDVFLCDYTKLRTEKYAKCADQQGEYQKFCRQNKFFQILCPPLSNTIKFLRPTYSEPFKLSLHKKKSFRTPYHVRQGSKTHVAAHPILWPGSNHAADTNLFCRCSRAILEMAAGGASTSEIHVRSYFKRFDTGTPWIHQSVVGPTFRSRFPRFLLLSSIASFFRVTIISYNRTNLRV